MNDGWAGDGRRAAEATPTVLGLNSRCIATVRRLLDLAGTSFVGHSAIIFAGFSLASLLGFVFQVASARLLQPGEFGVMQYALAIAELAGVLVTVSPVGLSTFLSRYREDAAKARAYYSSWLVVVGAMLLSSLIVTAAAAPAVVGITGWLLVGVLANLLGVTALETYREVARGLDRFLLVSVFYVVANLLQLLAILGAAALGHRSAALFVIVYGLSSVVTLVGMLLASPLRLSLALPIRREQMWEVLRFAQPVLAQSVFFTVWFRADVVVLERLQGSVAVGEYSAAKTLTYALQLAPSAVAFVLLPRIPRVPVTQLRGYLRRVLAVDALVIVPPILLIMAAAGPIIQLVFGERYAGAVAPLVVLAFGTGLLSFSLIFADLWLGLRRPVVDMASTALGMAVTVVAALLLVPRFDLMGAALAFTLGGAVRLGAAGVYTAVFLGRIVSRAQEEGPN
ncbi:MAG: oligosaccharide flippase family protein [Candidatus Dormibacteraeota bacterium]|nr:oligosaccharide flippase family protein [Candidatus Dormibacteraeota bacterium]